ncbi:unnamed protein product [Nezara viridula]|uniref:Uncharacterized protein n=1 Tax=Nezara viridula TaxID=85310 RepID=A0A9P0HPR9_NEZVI|nr:unnamed protein product [Nezara viridula]
MISIASWDGLHSGFVHSPLVVERGHGSPLRARNRRQVCISPETATNRDGRGPDIISKTASTSSPASPRLPIRRCTLAHIAEAVGYAARYLISSRLRLRRRPWMFGEFLRGLTIDYKLTRAISEVAFITISFEYSSEVQGAVLLE